MQKKIISSFLFLCCSTLAEDVEPVRPPLPTPFNIAIGVMASAAEKPIGQPLGFIQSRVIQNKSIRKSVDKNGNKIPLLRQISRYYRGLPTSMVCGGASTGIEIAANEKFLGVFKQDGHQITDTQKIIAASAAGIVSAHIDAPVETITLQQQNKGKDLVHTIESIKNVKPVSNNGAQIINSPLQGLQNFYRGYLTIMTRNTIQACGYLAFYEQLRKKGAQHISNEKLNNVLSATATGICTATLTHPLTFAKTRLHGDLEKAKYKNTFDVLNKAIKTEGLFSIFKGYVPRTIRSVFATGIMFNAQAKLKEFMSKNYHARKTATSIQPSQPKIPNPLDIRDFRSMLMNGG